MLTHDEMVGLQAERGELIEADTFRSNKAFVLHLIHSKAYETVAAMTRDKRVLDLGCNTGYGSHILRPACRSITGVDVSQKAIDVARSLYSGEDIDFMVIDGKRLPFDDNSFDLVASFQVIEHVVDRDSYINEIKRVLAPDGQVVFTTPNRLIRLHPGMRPWNEFHVTEYSPAELQEELGAHFNNVAITALFADEPLYSTELARVAQIRERARIKQDSGINPLVKNIVLLAMNLRASLAKRLHRQESFQHRYSTGNFRYDNRNLESGLDLMGVCSDNGREA